MTAHETGRTSEQRTLGRTIDSAAWGLFFVWIGIALLADVGWGIGLIGVGVITAGAQAWRKHLGLNVERFSAIVGVLFVIGGISTLLGLRVDVVPLLFVAAGLFLLASTWRARLSAGELPPRP